MNTKKRAEGSKCVWTAKPVCLRASSALRLSLLFFLSHSSFAAPLPLCLPQESEYFLCPLSTGDGVDQSAPRDAREVEEEEDTPPEAEAQKDEAAQQMKWQREGADRRMGVGGGAFGFQHHTPFDGPCEQSDSCSRAAVGTSLTTNLDVHLASFESSIAFPVKFSAKRRE